MWGGMNGRVLKVFWENIKKRFLRGHFNFFAFFLILVFAMEMDVL